MALRDKLEQRLLEYGLQDYEALAVVERVIQIADENNLEVKKLWDKNMEDYTSEAEEIGNYTLDELKTLEDAIFTAVWEITKAEVRSLLYTRMEDLAELIVKFK